MANCFTQTVAHNILIFQFICVTCYLLLTITGNRLVELFTTSVFIFIALSVVGYYMCSGVFHCDLCHLLQ